MDIPRRDVDFGLDAAAVPRDWCHDDAFETTFLNALSLLFPEGEKFFVDSVKQVQDRVTDPALRREVTGFIGQEAMHGRVETWLKGFLKGVRRRAPKTSAVAITCALEHFTAMLAESLLRDPRMRDGMDPSIRPLWLWHALEEAEHKAVAFDVYKAIGGGYVRRVVVMVLTTVVFFAVQGAVHARLMATRGILWKPWRWVRGATRFWIYPAFLTRLVPAYLAYFRPSFHPNDRDTTALLANWREALFGTDGILQDRVAA
jgi:predicted metal-dependent hydrolase